MAISINEPAIKIVSEVAKTICLISGTCLIWYDYKKDGDNIKRSLNKSLRKLDIIAITVFIIIMAISLIILILAFAMLGNDSQVLDITMQVFVGLLLIFLTVFYIILLYLLIIEAVKDFRKKVREKDLEMG